MPATSAALDAGARATQDAASADSRSTKPAVSTEPDAVADAGTSTREPSESTASGGTSATSSAAGQGGTGATAGSGAGAPSAGQGGASTPAPMPGELGAACSAASECDSGHCTDGVCCGARCQRECEKCNAAGKCELLDGEQDRGTCDDSRHTCTRGVCLLSNGSECTSSNDCASGVCAGLYEPDPASRGHCCSKDVVCTTTCYGCSADGESCAPTSGGACGQDGVCVNGQCSY